MKECKGCKVKKPISDYYVHKMMEDGHLNFCKDCVKIRVCEHRDRNVERIREYDRKRNRERCKDPHYASLRYLLNKSYKTKEKLRAWGMVEKKLKSQRPVACPICGQEKRIVAHHPDYSKPSYIIWCCNVCHRAIHNNKIEVEHESSSQA